MNLGGNFSLAALGTFNRSGGTVNLTGTFDNSADLLLDATTGSWNLKGGTILGGTVTGTGGSELVFTNSGGWLDGVTMDSGMNLTATSSFVRILSGLVLNGSASLGNGANIEFRGGGENPFTGSGEVIFASGTGSISVVGGTTLRIASTITIRGGTGNVGSSGGGLINQGTIDSDAAGRITVRGSNWDNQGTLRASGGDLQLQGTWTNNGTMDARAGVGVTALNGFTQSPSGTFTVEVAGAGNNGLVAVTGGASLAGTLSIDRSGGYVPTLGSSFTIMTYGSASGGFSSVAGGDAGGGNQFVPSVGATSLVLDVM